MADDSIYLQQRQKEQEILKTTEQFSKKFKNVIGNLQEVNTPLAKTIADLRETTKGSFKAAANAKELQQFTTKIAKATSDSADTTTKSYQKLSEGLDRLSGTSGFLDQLKLAQDNYSLNQSKVMQLEQDIADTEFKNRKSIQDFRDKIAKLELDRIRAEGLGQEENLKKITTEKEKQEKALTKFETQIFDTKREELEIQKNLLDTSKSNLEKLNETVDKQAKEIADQDTKFTMFGQGLKELTGFDLLGTLDTVVDKVDAVGKIFGNKDLSGTIASAFSFGGNDDVIPSIAGESQEIDPAIKIAKKELKEAEEMGDDVGDIKRLLQAGFAKDRVVPNNEGGGFGFNFIGGDILKKIGGLTIGGYTLKQIFSKDSAKKGGKGLLGAVIATAVISALNDSFKDLGDMGNRGTDDPAVDPDSTGANTTTNVGSYLGAQEKTTSKFNKIDALAKVEELRFKDDGTLDRRTGGYKDLVKGLKTAENPPKYMRNKQVPNKRLLQELYKITGTKNLDDLLDSPKLNATNIEKAFARAPRSALALSLKLDKALKAAPAITGVVDGVLDLNAQKDQQSFISSVFDIDTMDGETTFDEETTKLINDVFTKNQQGSVGRGIGSTVGASTGIYLTGKGIEKSASFIPAGTIPSAIAKGATLIAGIGISSIGAALGGNVGDELATFDKNAQKLQTELANIAYHYQQNPLSDIYQNDKLMQKAVDAAVMRYRNNVPVDNGQGSDIGGKLQENKNNELEQKHSNDKYLRNKNGIIDKEVSSLNNFKSNITTNHNHYGRSSFQNPDASARILDVKYS